jgi:hypothetical protein
MPGGVAADDVLSLAREYFLGVLARLPLDVVEIVRLPADRTTVHLTYGVTDRFRRHLTLVAKDFYSSVRHGYSLPKREALNDGIASVGGAQ